MSKSKNECTVETWLDLENFPNHQVSTFGRVRNKRNNHVLKNQLDRYGYPRLSIGSKDNVPIHRLVCETVYGKPVGNRNQVNHIDCNRQNNKANNLEWVTASENIKWGVTHGNLDPSIGLKKAVEVNKKPVRIIETGEIFATVKDCANSLGVPATNVSRVLKGKRFGQKLHGYHIEYIREEEI